MTDETPRKRDWGGRLPLPPLEKRRRIDLHLNYVELIALRDGGELPERVYGQLDRLIAKVEEEAKGK